MRSLGLRTRSRSKPITCPQGPLLVLVAVSDGWWSASGYVVGARELVNAGNRMLSGEPRRRERSAWISRARRALVKPDRRVRPGILASRCLRLPDPRAGAAGAARLRTFAFSRALTKHFQRHALDGSGILTRPGDGQTERSEEEDFSRTRTWPASLPPSLHILTRSNS